MQTLWTEMAWYFAEEKIESAVFVAVGAAAIALAVLFLWDGGALRGMAYPFIVIGLIQIGVGGSVYVRTTGQLDRLSVQAREQPDAFKREETARMETVVKSFRLYKIIEIVLLALGVGLTFAGPRKDLIYGIGMGLVVQAGVMLALDLLAEQRAAKYVDRISSFEVEP